MKLSAPIHQLKRRARLLARGENIPLHQALDRIAQEEGFAQWSLLSSRFPAKAPLPAILPKLAAGELLLLGARPGQGKTLMGLRLLLEAARENRRAVFFSLEDSERETRQRVRSLPSDAALGDRLEIVAADGIDADSIIRHLGATARGTVAVIDYLQILDQRRSKPPLADQLQALRAYAGTTGAALVFLSQIDRSFDSALKPVPDLADIRLPNPIDIGLFAKACFLHGGEVRLHQLT